jgi:hypothetical protein
MCPYPFKADGPVEGTAHSAELLELVHQQTFLVRERRGFVVHGDECTQEENSVGESSHEDSDNESDIGSDSGYHDTVRTVQKRQKKTVRIRSE